MKHGDIYAWILNGMAVVGTAIQTEDVFRIISLILTIFATLLSIALTIWTWWNKAKKDGIITPEEVKELKDKIEEERDKLK